ncbi:hypothetical protein [Streptomyces sp. PvR034]|uniref:hypothetical protein n=1 Tax=Streptomyces sp. PvR034 TaxID=3156401 RepID=UPI003394C5BE
MTKTILSAGMKLAEAFLPSATASAGCAATCFEVPKCQGSKVQGCGTITCCYEWNCSYSCG